MARKTYPIAELVQDANEAIRWATVNNVDEQRSAACLSICAMIERILHETGNYHGFQWIDETGNQMTTEQAQNIKIDDPCYYSRRFYLPKV